MQLDAWIITREQAGTLASVARQVLEKDAKYKDVERTLQSMYVLEALHRNDWNLSRAARAIDVSRMTIVRVLRAMNIQPEDIRKIAERMGRTDVGTV